MATLLKHPDNSRRPGVLSRHRSLLSLGLLTLALVGCGAKLIEHQVLNEPQQVVDENRAGIQRANSAIGGGQADSPSSSTTVAIDAMVEIEEVVVTGSFVSRSSATAASGVADRSIMRSEAISKHPQSAVRLSPSFPAEADRLAYHYGPVNNRENYLDLQENSVKLVSQVPVSTFSIDVDTAAYSNLRRIIMREGRLPPHDAIRLEEMINYFDYDYEAPASLDQPLAVHTELTVSPWNPSNQLLMIGIKGYEPAPEERPNANLVFLVDVSGSMQSPDKLGLVKRSLKLLVEEMGDEDRIALVVYAGAAGVVLDSTSASDKSKIRNAIDSLTAGGSTNGAAGIALAYRIAEDNLIEGGINRVIIASDGDMNVGVTSIDALKELITQKRDNGVALTTLGFGSGNYNYSLMEQIADVGNGSAAYIDSLNEARKVLVEELQSTLLTIAKDVKIQIEFNPAVVSEYRLIGYENRVLNREDCVNDKVDAGEIGAGHTVTALYEVTLVGSEGGLIPASRYATPRQTDASVSSDELAYVKIRYKHPDAQVSTEMGVAVMVSDVAQQTDTASNDIRFAAAVAGFGELLRGGKYLSDWDYDQLLQLARQARGSDPHGYRSEMLNLIEMARLL